MGKPDNYDLDLGMGYYLRFYGWHPDRDIPANAERYKDQPDIEYVGALIFCPHEHHGGIQFDTPEVNSVFPSGAKWTLHSLDPLHVEPSILRSECRCHGWIRNGQWEAASDSSVQPSEPTSTL